MAKKMATTENKNGGKTMTSEQAKELLGLLRIAVKEANEAVDVAGDSYSAVESAASASAGEIAEAVSEALSSADKASASAVEVAKAVLAAYQALEKIVGG